MGGPRKTSAANLSETTIYRIVKRMEFMAALVEFLARLKGILSLK
jgi:hypothetical protein